MNGKVAIRLSHIIFALATTGPLNSICVVPVSRHQGPGGLSASPSDSSAALSAARRVLELARRGRLQKLQQSAEHGQFFQERLFASYVLYRGNPSRYRNLFCKAFPVKPVEVDAFLRIYSELPYDPAAEGNRVSHPSVKWPISFWDIEQAMLACVRTGHPDAVRRFMGLAGRGDGEVGEGLGSDIMDLFVLYPNLIVNHWPVFSQHLGFFDEWEAWYDEDQIRNARKTYKSLLKPSDARYSLILNRIHKPQ